MNYIFKYFLPVVLILILINSFNRENTYTTPHSPPTLKVVTFYKDEINHKEIEHYQEQLLNYIDYLVNLYENIGWHYGVNNKFPGIRKNQDQCKLYDYIFNEILLPEPITKYSDDIDLTILKLVDQIKELRKTIRENNATRNRLREYYKGCF